MTKLLTVVRNVANRSARSKRLEKLGIGPDGKPLPIPNTKKLFPRMYPCLVVNQDGSTYHINHCHPHHIITLPLDPLTLTQEEREVREKQKRRAKDHQYISDEDQYEDDEWDHSQYKDLLR